MIILAATPPGLGARGRGKGAGAGAEALGGAGKLKLFIICDPRSRALSQMKYSIRICVQNRIITVNLLRNSSTRKRYSAKEGG